MRRGAGEEEDGSSRLLTLGGTRHTVHEGRKEGAHIYWIGAGGLPPVCNLVEKKP